MSSFHTLPFRQFDPVSAGANQLVDEFISAALGRVVDSARVLNLDERAMVFRQLSRAAELAKDHPPGERLTWTEADLDEADRACLAEPHLDRFVAGLRSRPALVPAKTISCWPQNHPFALCLSHDMDHVTAFTGAEQWHGFRRYVLRHGAKPAELVRRGWRAGRSLFGGWVKRDLYRRRDPFDNVGQWLSLEAACGFSSSLFFFAETIQPWDPSDCNYGFHDRIRFENRTITVGQMMREIAGRGWDVSVHGSLASATEPGVLDFQKRQVESVLGQQVLTTRQHYLQYDLRQTPALQAQAGFLADGTQGFNDTLGFRGGTSFPYRVWDWSNNRLLPLWQVPLHIQDLPLLRRRPTVDQAIEICGQFLDRVQAVGGCLGLLFHPAHLATDLGFSVYGEVLREAQRRGAWGCSMRQAAEWWQTHTLKVLGKSSGKPTAALHVC